MSPLALGALLVTLGLLLLADVLLFARGREPTFRESAAWSVGWLLLGLGAALPIATLSDGERGLHYVTVYLIERSLSLDNLFVFLLIFAYFGVPHAHRGKLILYGIVLALVVRGAAILVGVELIERFHFVLYLLGAMLLYLAYRMLRGVAEHVEPSDALAVRAVRRVLPVTDGFRGERFVVTERSRRSATPLLLALAAIVAADIAFAADSIPAAFAITTDSLVIWTANAFALLGLRPLFTLVESLTQRLRYLDETIAVVLALVAVKLLVEDVIHIGPVLSLGLVLATFGVGVTASFVVDRRDPAGVAERKAKARPGAAGVQPDPAT